MIPEADAETGTWRKLDGPDDIVEFYDPTDIFGDLADTLAEAFPALGGTGAAGEDVEDVEDEEEEPEPEPEPAPKPKPKPKPEPKAKEPKPKRK
ncbi:MAG: hypothetical protein ACXWNI_02160 [Candidatus Limnocylindrales bacterium]